MLFDDPGPCIICGAPHQTCTADSGPVTVDQLPSRTAALQATKASVTAPAAVVPPQTFSTKTYRREKGR